MTADDDDDVVVSREKTENRARLTPRFRARRTAESGGAARTSSVASRARAPQSGTRTVPGRHVDSTRRVAASIARKAPRRPPISRDRRGRRPPSGPVRRSLVSTAVACTAVRVYHRRRRQGQRPIFSDRRRRPFPPAPENPFARPSLSRAHTTCVVVHDTAAAFFFRFSLHGPVYLRRCRILLRLITSRRITVCFFAPTLDRRRRPIVTRRVNVHPSSYDYRTCT